MKRLAAIFVLTVALALPALAQTDFGGVARLDRTVHDFGDIALKDGPVSCSFTLTNISSEELLITSVVSSCGCTGVKWTRETLKSGASGRIEATYANDEGPYPFDKTLTVYVNQIRRPIILHIKGVSHDRKKSLEELYPEKLGLLGLKALEIKAGNLQQEETISGEFTVANLGRKAVRLDFSDVAPGLSLKTEGPIAPGATGKVFYTIRADRSRWGRNDYTARLHAGAAAVGSISIWAVTKENFSSLTAEQRKTAPRPMFAESTFSFNPVKAGTRFEASFNCVNEGKEPLKVYKIETDNASVAVPALPGPLAPGGKMRLKFNVDTTGCPEGEQLYMITLYTNAPLRPIINLFVAGFIK